MQDPETPQEKTKIATLEEVRERFKLETRVVDVQGLQFKIRKLALIDLVGANLFSIPMVKQALEGTLTMDKAERKQALVKYVLENKQDMVQLQNVALMTGVLEPALSENDLADLSSEFKDELTAKVLDFSGFGKTSEFFRSVP